MSEMALIHHVQYMIFDEKAQLHGVRHYSNAHNIEAEKAPAVGMSDKAAQFKIAGSEIYHGNAPEGAKHDH